MHNTAPLNWKPVVASLFQTLAAQGFTVETVNNGDDDVNPKTMREAIEEATACDEAEVWFTHADDRHRFWLHVVLGNAVCETPSNFSCRNTATGKLFEQTIEQWSDSMEGIECPHEGELFQGAFKDVVAALQAILTSNDAPSGATMGEARLCQQFAAQARAALAHATGNF